MILLHFTMSCATYDNQSTEWNIPDNVIRNTKELDAVFIDENCRLFTRMDKISWSRFQFSSDYGWVIRDSGVKYTTECGGNQFYDGYLDYIRKWVDEQYNGAIYVVPFLDIRPVEDLRFSWKTEVYYCKYSEAYFIVSNYYNGVKASVNSYDTIAILHDVPPARIFYYIRLNQ